MHIAAGLYPFYLYTLSATVLPGYKAQEVTVFRRIFETINGPGYIPCLRFPQMEQGPKLLLLPIIGFPGPISSPKEAPDLFRQDLIEIVMFAQK
jgi:hypothetical protein